MAKRATALDIAGIAVPRIAFGLGSLMKWAPNHAYPLPTDSSTEVRNAIAAGFRHFNTGDLYTNNPSAAEVLKSSGLQREDVFFSLKLNTYQSLGCTGAQSMIDSTAREIERFGLQGYVDLLQLHFPPRGHPGNLSNREAWRVLEGLKDRGIARIIGVSNWSLKDYHDLMDAGDLKHPVQVNEYEFNSFLQHDPSFQALRAFEQEHGIVPMNYGFLSILNGKLSAASSSNLVEVIERRIATTELASASLLLSWAHDRLGGIVVSSTSQKERAAQVASLFLSDDAEALPGEIYDEMEEAAARDGYAGKVFYKHGHMDAASRQSN